jgi:hypothetical protein
MEFNSRNAAATEWFAATTNSVVTDFAKMRNAKKLTRFYEKKF